MARRGRKKNPQSRPSQSTPSSLDPPLAVAVKEDEYCTIGTKYNPCTKDWIGDHAHIEAIRLYAQKRQATNCSSKSAEIIQPSSRQVLYRPDVIASMLSTPATTQGTIGVLPPEIQELVIQNLSWDAAIHLAGANKYYRSIIKPADYGNPKERANFLRQQEEKPKYNHHKTKKSWFACTGCWCLKLAKRFDSNQICGAKLRKGGKSWRTRRCLACEIELGRYRSYAIISNGAGKIMRICRLCQDFRTGIYCEECGLCQSCMGALEEPKCPRYQARVRLPPELLAML